MSSPNTNNTPHPPYSQIPTQFRAISRNNSNISTASSSNKGDLGSSTSTANSAASSRSQQSKHHQLIDHRQLLATCGGSSTPIRSFQRATISSVVKTRAFDNNPILQGLLASPVSGHSSISNSQNPSPHPTPIFSRSRSLRMSGGPQRYQQTPSYYRTSSRTPELYSFNSGDISSCSNDSQAKLVELNNEKLELKESLEFLECERQVLIDSAKDLKENLQRERSHYKKEIDELKKQLTDAVAAKVRAESYLTQNDVGMNEMQLQMKKLNEEISLKDRQLDALKKDHDTLQKDNTELLAMNRELKLMLSEKLKYNGLRANQHYENTDQNLSDCVSIVTEMARLRLELNEKERIIQLNNHQNDKSSTIRDEHSKSADIESLNRFLDQTVECIKGWPEELAGSSHVQNLMKTLLSAYKADQDELCLNFRKFHL